MKILYLSDKMSQTLSSGISKFTTPAPLCLHTFLHRMNTSGVEIWPILKKTNDIFWTWKANIAKIIIAVDYFCKSLRCRCLTGFPIYLGFWICHGSEYVRVLNMPRFWIQDTLRQSETLGQSETTDLSSIIFLIDSTFESTTIKFLGLGQYFIHNLLR